VLSLDEYGAPARPTIDMLLLCIIVVGNKEKTVSITLIQEPGAARGLFRRPGVTSRT
jgi:hypothetical protein